jgi:hypothetical protein
VAEKESIIGHLAHEEGRGEAEDGEERASLQTLHEHKEEEKDGKESKGKKKHKRKNRKKDRAKEDAADRREGKDETQGDKNETEEQKAKQEAEEKAKTCRIAIGYRNEYVVSLPGGGKGAARKGSRGSCDEPIKI